MQVGVAHEGGKQRRLADAVAADEATLSPAGASRSMSSITTVSP